MINNTGSRIVGCRTKCPGGNISKFSDCTGSNGCCSSSIYSQMVLQEFSVSFDEDGLSTGRDQACNYAFLAKDSLTKETDIYGLLSGGYMQGLLDWGVADNGGLQVTCGENDSHPSGSCFRGHSDKLTDGLRIYYCSKGYVGNPYLIDGCQDINECEDPDLNHCPIGCENTAGSFHCKHSSNTIKLALMIGIGTGIGILLLLLLGWWLHKIGKKREEIKRKEKFFKRNGGVLLQQQLSAPEGNVERSKLFDSKELEKATDNFNEDRVLGKGHQGTVYKGMLTDGRIVVVKKSAAVDAGNVKQFINEVLVLSQINHRSVVKLLGCCLETEVPHLVYEFIPNGTLYQYIHEPDERSPVTWEARLQIATEVAGALSYLHSGASIPIYHRDIKSTNILLDENYRAKVADFGTSRSLSLDQTRLTTLVQGTIGYLDPEYSQSNQLTDKSDVYSFGVVLVELLTGREPVSSLRVHDKGSLASYFILSMEEDHLLDILDPEILKQDSKEEIIVAAHIARRCLNMKGKKRPTVRQVAMELEAIQSSRSPVDIQLTGIW
ncbi:wall-associated receptor kinase-like 22 [Punica granatum]|uniref:Wall-associated receptor kinase-like 22 n=1 Tax=Punica granatum TaxID=22663 RepID=A0A6P8CBN5_PUNGR|nr:wall-associated receptor kinase-like 22 [Punica granatum]